jgi:flagellar hook-associated protein 3 FlgL
MRIADKMAFQQVNSTLAKNREELTDLQNQAATQRRVNKPSDDPVAATRVLHSKTEERTDKQFVKSLNIAKSFLETTEQSLNDLTEALVRAKELAINQSNDASANGDSRKTIAAEVDQLLNQSIQIGNRKLGDRYIFSGHKTTTSPFDNKGNYFGDEGDIKIQVNKDSFVAMNIPGNKLFQGVSLNDDGVARASIDTPRTADDLKVLKESIENRKNKEGEENELRQVYTKQLRDLASVKSVSEASDDAETQQKIQSNGVNIFETLKGLSVALKTNDKQAIQSQLDVIDQALAQVILARSQVGARVSSLNTSLETLQKSIIDAKQMASSQEDADVFELVSDINKNDTALKATLQTSGKMIQPSLLDFLR